MYSCCMKCCSQFLVSASPSNKFMQIYFRSLTLNLRVMTNHIFVINGWGNGLQQYQHQAINQIIFNCHQWDRQMLVPLILFSHVCNDPLMWYMSSWQIGVAYLECLRASWPTMVANLLVRKCWRLNHSRTLKCCPQQLNPHFKMACVNTITKWLIQSRPSWQRTFQLHHWKSFSNGHAWPRTLCKCMRALTLIYSGWTGIRISPMSCPPLLHLLKLQQHQKNSPNTSTAYMLHGRLSTRVRRVWRSRRPWNLKSGSMNKYSSQETKSTTRGIARTDGLVQPKSYFKMAKLCSWDMEQCGWKCHQIVLWSLGKNLTRLRLNSTLLGLISMTWQVTMIVVPPTQVMKINAMLKVEMTVCWYTWRWGPLHWWCR